MSQWRYGDGGNVEILPFQKYPFARQRGTTPFSWPRLLPCWLIYPCMLGSLDKFPEQLSCCVELCVHPVHTNCVLLSNRNFVVLLDSFLFINRMDVTDS